MLWYGEKKNLPDDKKARAESLQPKEFLPFTNNQEKNISLVFHYIYL